MSEIKYSIEAHAYDIVGVAAHDFWVLRDEKGKVLGQLHGLATNIENKIKPIGIMGDKLKFYHFGSRAILLGLNPNCDLNYIKAGQKSKPIFSGSSADVLDRWDNAVKALPYLNDLEVPYTPFAILGLAPINSNTAYTLLGKLMGIPVHNFSGYWQPGLRNIHKLLTSSQLESMRYPQELPDIV
ncbi:hypothetical protein [Methylobacter sp.]|uniref:hypothetical protein n=1 Tax=Methylobacter sp. TaxID=2051955 RepID=UPI002FDD530C